MEKIFSKYFLGQERYHPSKKYTLIHKEEPKKTVLDRILVCASNPKRHGCCGIGGGYRGFLDFLEHLLLGRADKQ